MSITSKFIPAAFFFVIFFTINAYGENTAVYNERIVKAHFGFVISKKQEGNNYLVALHDGALFVIPENHPIIKGIQLQTFPPRQSGLCPGLNAGIAQVVFESGRVDWHLARICARAQAGYFINKKHYDIHDDIVNHYDRYAYKREIQELGSMSDSVMVSSWPVAGIYLMHFDNVNIQHNINELRKAMGKQDREAFDNESGYIDFIYINVKNRFNSILYLQKTVFDKEIIYKNQPE